MTAFGWGTPASAKTADLRIDTTLALAAATSAPAPVSRQATAAEETPLRLEYQLITRVEHLTQTTRDIHTIVDRLPGPGLAGNAAPPKPMARFTDPYEEILARLDHASLLVTQITAILNGMPSTTSLQNRGREIHAVPVVPNPATQTQEQSHPVSRRKPPLTPTTLVRIAILALGVLLALFLVRQAPKLRRKPRLEFGNASDQIIPVASSQNEQDQSTSASKQTPVTEPQAKAA